MVRVKARGGLVKWDRFVASEHDGEKNYLAIPDRKVGQGLSNKGRTSDKEKRTREEALSSLKRQIHFIRKSCAEFDRGDVNEATRIANHVAMIVHDSNHSTSLLTQLGKKEIPFIDTSTPDTPGNLMPYTGLYYTFMGVGVVDYKPHLDDGPFPPRKVDFNEWWNNLIFNNKKEWTYSRKDIVLFVRDTDGGAHVDPDLEKTYAKLIREKSFGWTITVNGVKSKPKTGPDQASLRQIAHEILLTLKAAFQNL